MKRLFTDAFRGVATALLLLAFPFFAYAQHGGGHGGGGHSGGHFGERAHAGREGFGKSDQADRITRYPPFSAVRIFRHRHRILGEPYFFANGLLLGGYVNCSLWDWGCGWGCGLGWDNGYVDFGNWMNSAPEDEVRGFGAAGESQSVTVLYLKNGYSVGVTDYHLDEGELHYMTTYGSEDSVPISQVDLQRTVNENASMGVTFILHPRQAPKPPENH